MKAEPGAQRRLLDLAEIDTELTQINHRRRALPELAEIAEVDKAVRDRRDDLVAAQTSFGDIDRDAKKLETEIEQVRAREDKDRKLLQSGSVTSPKQLEDLQHELATLERRQGVLEDDLLELMERREALETDVVKAQEALSSVEAGLADAVQRRDRAFGELDNAESRKQDNRRLVAKQLPEDLAALYERIRGKGGQGAALLQARRCGACRVELHATAMTALRALAGNDVARCEECGTILIRTGESGL
ncbi:hypothetical protein D5S17_07475 [Pseudonocardiaceae bacterium YIM PH 21723]|nr:hypothetical protein D5S17_07475 [Pseudonocardiaceae bacterium YIM PH 21723]